MGAPRLSSRLVCRGLAAEEGENDIWQASWQFLTEVHLTSLGDCRSARGRENRAKRTQPDELARSHGAARLPTREGLSMQHSARRRTRAFVLTSLSSIGL